MQQIKPHISPWLAVVVVGLLLGGGWYLDARGRAQDAADLEVRLRRRLPLRHSAGHPCPRRCRRRSGNASSDRRSPGSNPVSRPMAAIRSGRHPPKMPSTRRSSIPPWRPSRRRSPATCAAPGPCAGWSSRSIRWTRPKTGRASIRSAWRRPCQDFGPCRPCFRTGGSNCGCTASGTPARARRIDAPQGRIRGSAPVPAFHERNTGNHPARLAVAWDHC
jgi:hypothetical protein